MDSEPDRELETAQATYLAWQVERVSDPDSAQHGRLRARQGNYIAVAPNLDSLRRQIIEYEKGRGLTAEAKDHVSAREDRGRATVGAGPGQGVG